jgi:16S rRNA (uracil1498-N3)-methyltransferase
MLRLYVPTPPGDDGTVRISRSEVRHLRTLRLRAGDRVCVFDEHGREHEVVLERVAAGVAVGRVLITRMTSRESPLELVLLPALVKRDKMDWIVEKATELGVVHLAPVVTRHTVARGDHVERWRRIARAAAKQCGRTRIPTVDPPRKLADALVAGWPGLRLLAWEDEPAVRLADLPARADAVTVLIGPEGGFAGAEVAAARAAGFTTIRLGRRVLRAETAAVVATALCQQRWGDG